VLGWSMGGNIAELLVERHPANVNRLILAATDPGSPRAVLPTDPLAVKLLNEADTPISQILKVIFPRTSAGRRAGKAYIGRVGTWLAGFGPDALTTASATVNAQIRAEGPLWFCRPCGAYAKLPRVRAPTLVTDGALDVIEPPENSRIIARRIPGARLTLYRGAGHAHLFQYHGRYAGQVNGFLSG
jgi:pimeloyl-ACP methyl ester carboxylesterase